MSTIVAQGGRATQPNWFRFIALSGEEGDKWVQEYRQPECRRLTGEISQALELLRKRQIEAGGDLLLKVVDPLRNLTHSHETIGLVLERIYNPVLAYYYYCIEDLDAAEEALEVAGGALQRAILLRPFLVPLADSFIDFTFQRARIARNRQRWVETRNYLSKVDGMIQGKLPFCRLSDGTEIDLAVLRHFYSLLPLAEEDRLLANYVFDDNILRSVLEKTEAEIYCQIGLLIPYP
jgi:hypothetical protein